MKHITTVLLILLSTASYGQATMMIVVADMETAGPLTEANISLQREGQSRSTATTNEHGVAYIKNVPYGEYHIAVSKEGYAPKMTSASVTEPKTYAIEISLVRGGSMESEFVAVAKYKGEGDVMSSAAESLSSPPIAAARHYTATRSSFLPSSGQVTASEWNDLHNWQSWLALLADEDYQIMTERWGIAPTKRQTVLVLNKLNVPIVNAKVSLIGPDSKLIWQAYTDNVGKAELWSGVYGADDRINEIWVEHKGKREKAEDLDHADGKVHKVIMEQGCSEISSIDIAFTVDATGSMGDEISFLKAELLDVIDRVKADADGVDVRTGAVFYRDDTDDYLTRESPLSDDVEVTMSFIKEQHADGGGDYPEAVHTAMEKTLELDWRVDALKLNFLILDAPPREDTETLASIHLQIKKAAAQGIRLVPITASGINRETEFLMKFMAILTNGTYVFITDDSGIGNPHLDPVVKDAEVEKLNDLMVRVITEFATMQDCEVPYEDLKAADISIYPNPCSNYINIITPYIPLKIVLTSNSGMVIKSLVPTESNTRLELEEFLSGVYNVSIYSELGVETRSVLVVR